MAIRPIEWSVLMDYAPELNYYSTDITRTWPVDGKFTDVQLKYYNCIKDVSESVVAAVKPGVTIQDLVDIAAKIYAKHGCEKLHPNGIGHFVGMAVHDVGCDIGFDETKRDLREISHCI